MTIRRFSPWAAAAAVAMTYATGAGIESLARVDTPAAGLPVLQLEPVVVSAARALPATVQAGQLLKGRTL